MAVVLFDTDRRRSLYPLTYTKAVAGLFYGIFTITERWQRLLTDTVFIQTADYLQGLYTTIPQDVHTYIDARVLASPDVIDKIKLLQQGDVLADENGIIACKGKGTTLHEVMEQSAMNFITVENVERLVYPHQLLSINKDYIQSDFDIFTGNRTSQPLPTSCQYKNPENIFIEAGATVDFAIINAEKGPVYIGANVTIMEGALLKGPVAICDNSIVKMGSKIYGATSVGRHCTVGGEIKNIIMQSFSNKAHDGYLGDSVIGEWCNFGAGATNSNVKNTAGDIRFWSEYDYSFINAGDKCGVMMGDYTKVAINSSINTGSVYGISCNVFGEGLLPVWLRNFSWGVSGQGYAIDKAIRHIRQWKNFKQQPLSKEEESVLAYIFDNFINQ